MSKSHWKSLILGIVFGLVPVFVCAAGSYTGTVPVATQSDKDRAAALRTALSQVVTQAAKGNASVLRRPDVARALARPERYVHQVAYQPDTAPAQPGKPPAKFLLVAQFDAAQIDALVRDDGAAAAAANAASAVGANPAAASAPSVANAPSAQSDIPVPAPAAIGADAQAAAVPDETAVATGAAGSYRLWFSGLRSAEDYARLVGALSASPEVRALRVEEAHGDVLQARIDTLGSLRSLTDSLAAAHVAHVANTKPPVEGVDAVLDFEP
jgi:hypothetical protein